MLRPDARAAGRSWPVRVLLALPTFGLLFGLVTGVIGLGVLLAIDASSTVSSSVATSALLVSFAVGLIPGVLFGTRLWSGQTRPTGFHLIVGELGAQWVCQDRGAVTSTAARYDGEEAWVHDMTGTFARVRRWPGPRRSRCATRRAWSRGRRWSPMAG